MNKVKSFFAKYKKYILAGVILGAILGLTFWLFNREKGSSTVVTISSINSPFTSLEYNTSIDQIPNNIDIPKELQVYKTTKPDIDTINNFVAQFYKGNSVSNGESGALLWNFNTTNISYVLDSSLVFLTSSNGVSIDSSIESKQDVLNFLSSSFEMDNIEITDETDLGKGKIQYNGYLSFEGNTFGSVYLEGYGIQLVVKKNILYSLSLLFLPSTNITDYQVMPSSQLKELLTNTKYPMYVSYISEDDNYKKQNAIIKASMRLKSFSIKTYENINLFEGFSYGYIFPAYKLEGDGNLIDSQNQTYWADTNLYICSLNSEYLLSVDSHQNNLNILDPAQ